MAARLTRDTIASSELVIAARRTRAAGARSWYGAMTLPSAVRAAMLRVVQASEQGNISELHAAFEDVVTNVSTTCDGASRAELKRLLQGLEAIA
jgi:hypothetical protein